jgi:predicted phosphodiesterase
VRYEEWTMAARDEPAPLVRVAALYDVHGNLPALRAVLGDVPGDATIVVGGDVVMGPFPAETLHLLRSLSERVRWIRGNGDRELTPGEAGLAPASEIDWVRARLSPDDIAFLHGLPPTLALEVVGLGRALFCHATPHSDLDIFTAVTPKERVAPHFAGVDADVVICGHTHIQFDRTVAGVRIVNAGSVGMAYENEPGAYWALLGPDVEFRRTSFEPDLGDYPGEWPSATRTEATDFFERLAV